MNYYDEIYEELCYRVEEGELSLEDAEIINETAYDRYMAEATRLAKEIHKKAKIFKDNNNILLKQGDNFPDEIGYKTNASYLDLWSMGADPNVVKNKVPNSLDTGKKISRELSGKDKKDLDTKTRLKIAKKQIKGKKQKYHTLKNLIDRNEF